MSRRGNCYDNAPMESFFGSLKTECIDGQTYRTPEEARRAIFKYLEVFYNLQRKHSSLGFVKLVVYEQLLIVFNREDSAESGQGHSQMNSMRGVALVSSIALRVTQLFQWPPMPSSSRVVPG